MDTLADKPPQDPGNGQTRSPEGDVQAQVRELLGALYPRSNVTERRGGRRYPFPYVVHLTPVAPDGVSPESNSVTVVGKHLSECGLGFFHAKPLPHRRMIATIETSEGSLLAFLIDLNWCRFTTQGWYESGGRLLQTVAPPL